MHRPISHRELPSTLNESGGNSHLVERAIVTINSNSVMADDVIARARVAPNTLHPQDEKSVIQRMRIGGPKEVIRSQVAFGAPVIDHFDGREYWG